MPDIAIRAAQAEDIEPVAELAAELVRMHHDADAGRFFMPERVADGYAGWFRRELARPAAVILVATIDRKIVGYAYGTLEARDWNRLLDAHGAIHDVFVSRDVRRAGVGRRLLAALSAELEDRGAPRLVLSTMSSNTSAQQLFRSCGFRATMLEMTKEPDGNFRAR